MNDYQIIAGMSTTKTLLFEAKTGEYIDSPQFMQHIALKLILDQSSDNQTVTGRLHYVERALGCYHDLEFTHFSKGHECAVVGEHLVTTGRLFPITMSQWLTANIVRSVAESGGRRPDDVAPDHEYSFTDVIDPDASSVFKEMQFTIAPEPSALWDAPETCTLSLTQGGNPASIYDPSSLDLKLVDLIANDDDIFCNSPLL